MTGEPTFFEMGVADMARARAFYSGLFGWRLEPGASAGGYRISTPTIPGGMHGNDVGAGALVFFGVPDLEAAMARVRDLGGHAEALESRADQPREGSFGHFALCRDDQGSPFGLHQPLEAEGEGTRGPAAHRPTIDHVTLRVRDLPASRRFYEAALAPLSLGLEFEHEGLLAFGSGRAGGSSSTQASGPSPGSTSLSLLPAGRP
jgi:predicted enzyme related to lactoylglutathione lyase